MYVHSKRCRPQGPKEQLVDMIADRVVRTAVDTVEGTADTLLAPVGTVDYMPAAVVVVVVVADTLYHPKHPSQHSSSLRRLVD